MFKRFLALVLLLFLFPSAFAARAQTLSSGDMLLVLSSSVPLYASYRPNDSTVITYLSRSETVMYIASADRGFCVAYGNFVGYVPENAVLKIDAACDFCLPDGSAFKELTSSRPSAKPGNGTPSSNVTSRVPAFPYTEKPIIPNQNIATRSGPSTQYTSTGTFPSSLSYTAYYQTTGSSVNWGYVEFTYQNQKYRLYTGVKRFGINSYLSYDQEESTLVTITRTHNTYYGPGYDYAQSPFEAVSTGETVKAFYAENGWVFIEYTLSDGTLHRGWSPEGFWR